MDTNIYRGTTPSITLNVVGVDLSNAMLWPIVIVTVENGRNSFDISRDNLNIELADGGCAVEFTLTQAQTLQMSKRQTTMFQLRAKDFEGHSIATPIKGVYVVDVLKEDEI